MPETIDETFIEQIKHALENLYDLPYLQKHPLAQGLSSTSNELIGHSLRRELMAAIETLNPGKSFSARSGPARLYNLMHLHYVGGMSLQETSLELGISLRQVYRDLRRGHESISEIIRIKRQQSQHKTATNDVIIASSLQSEVARLEGEASRTTINDLLKTALKAVSQLAEDKGIAINLNETDKTIPIITNTMVAQQVIVSILSQTIQHALPDAITIILHDRENRRTMATRLRTHAGEEPQLVKPVIAQFIEALGWRTSMTRTAPDEFLFTLRMGGRGIVLIVDDNQGLVELLERYFSDQMYHVISAHSGEEGLKLARETTPDAIIMDLMMPGMDGWELLQHLRTQPQTRAIPVIICSVINDPQLAYSLGASTFISKPVNKDTILNALKQVGL